MMMMMMMMMISLRHDHHHHHHHGRDGDHDGAMSSGDTFIFDFSPTIKSDIRISRALTQLRAN